MAKNKKEFEVSEILGTEDEQYKEIRRISDDIDNTLTKFNVDGFTITLDVDKNVRCFIQVTKIYIDNNGNRVKREMQ
jgi:hypothetical protein